MNPNRQLIIAGAGSGGSSSKTHVPTEAKDTLTLSQWGRVIDLLSEGEIEGLCDPQGNILTGEAMLKAVYFDGTPVMNADGSPNFGNVLTDRAGHTNFYVPLTSMGMSFTNGTQAQAMMPDMPRTENIQALGRPLMFETPVTFQVSNPDTDVIEIAVKVPSLQYINIKTGDIKGNSVGYLIWINHNGSGFYLAAGDSINGKASAPYVHSTWLILPRAANNAPNAWTIKVQRITPDTYASTNQVTTTVDYVTEIVLEKLTYPNCALVMLQFSARVLSTMPQRSYLAKLLRVKVPTNYFPDTRAYTRGEFGDNMVDEQPWDGTFHTAWTDNPAWCFYDLCTNSRYGLGDVIPPDLVDKWTLYRIARYCDEMVDSGYGYLEPRFTCNVYIQTRNDAYKVLTDMASVFRGILYWSSGSIVAVQDAPKDPVYLFTNANVKDGVFTYSGTAKRARHTTVLVGWKDPDDKYTQKYVYVEDPTLIATYGLREMEIVAFGCTSRGQAYRLGRWILETESRLTDAVSYSTGMEGHFLHPGDVVKIADSLRTQNRAGGRIASISDEGHTLILDKPLNYVFGDSLSLQVPQLTMPPGFDIGSSDYIQYVRNAQFLDFTPSNSESAATDRFTFTDPLPASVEPGMIWLANSSDIPILLYRVLSATENTERGYDISALLYVAAIYDEVEKGVPIQPASLAYSGGSVFTPLTGAAAPSTFSANLSVILLGGSKAPGIVLTWLAPTDGHSYVYNLVVNLPSGGTEVLPSVKATTSSYLPSAVGEYTFDLVAQNAANQRSSTVTTSITITLETLQPFGRVTGLELVNQGNNSIYTGETINFQWRVNSRYNSYELGSELGGADSAPADPLLSGYNIQIFDANAPGALPLITDQQTDTVYSFVPTALVATTNIRRFRLEVRHVATNGAMSTPGLLWVDNPVPAALVFTGGALVGAGLFTLSALKGQIFVAWTLPQENGAPITDFGGVRVWLSTAAITPTTAQPIYDGISNPVVLSAPNAVTYHVVVSVYDTIGIRGCIYSAEATIMGVPDSTASDLAIHKAEANPHTPLGRSDIPYAANIALDLLNRKFYVIGTVTGPLTFSSPSAYPVAGSAVFIYVRMTSDSSAHSLAFPPLWTFVGAKPTVTTAIKTMLLELQCYGASDAEVIARWTVQP